MIAFAGKTSCSQIFDWEKKRALAKILAYETQLSTWRHVWAGQHVTDGSLVGFLLSVFFLKIVWRKEAVYL